MTAQTEQTNGASSEELYLDLRAACLTRMLFGFAYVPAPAPTWRYQRAAFKMLNARCTRGGSNC